MFTEEFLFMARNWLAEVNCGASIHTVDVFHDKPRRLGMTYGKWGPDREVIPEYIVFSDIWIQVIDDIDIARELVMHEAAHYQRGIMPFTVFEYTRGHDYVWEDLCASYGIAPHHRFDHTRLKAEPDWQSYE